jgi:hypothetical protein
MAAHSQWASRPADETFSSQSKLLDFTRERRAKARATSLNFTDFDVENHNDEVVLTKGSRKIGFTNWAFTQFCARVGQTPTGVKDLPADLVTPVLQYRLDQLVDAGDVRDSQVLFSQESDGLLVRSFHGSQYTRVWDYQVVEKLSELTVKGWDVPPSYRPGVFGGEKERCAGLYCGDRDMFCFLVNEKSRIDDGSDKGLARGFIVSNSEVGASSYVITKFLYRYVCGNHMIWGMQDEQKFSIRHVGDADQKAMESFKVQLEDYAGQSASKLESGIKKAKAFEIGSSEEEVVDEVFKTRILPKRTIQRALEEAVIFEEIDGNPWSAWGLAQGVSRISQREDHASVRVNLEKATQKILALAS